MIYLVGMGPGGEKQLTGEAIEILQTADRLIAFGRIAETAEKFSNAVVRIDKLEDVEKNLTEGTNAVLASGDACFYGILDFLKKSKVEIDLVIPGISSIQLMMCRIHKSWHNATFFSFHGKDDDYDRILDSSLSIVLTDGKTTPNMISKRLFEKGARGYFYVGYNLSYSNEIILFNEIGGEVGHRSDLSVTVVELKK